MSVSGLLPVIPALRPNEEDARAEVGRFASEDIAPHAAEWEERQEMPVQPLRDLCAMGFGGATLPTDVGGAGLTHIGALACFEELAFADMSTAFVLLCQNSCVRSIWLHGTVEQRERWLPPLLTGEQLGAYVITEPDAGSDPASMKATAVEDDAGFVLDAHKTLITNAPLAGVFLVSAKTDPDLGARGVSTFVLRRDARGLRVGDRLPTLGARALELGELYLESCHVENEALLGTRGEGFKLALDAVNWARVVWAGLASGLARASLAGAIDYLKQRVQFDRPLIEFQAIQFQLADLATEIEAARLLGYRAAELMDRGTREAISAAAMATRYAGDMVVRVTAAALELLGGVGYLTPSPLERYLRQARMAQLADGAGNIQRLVIARSLA